jgi:hypothetical protein
MKTVLLFCLASFLFAICANAQISKGTVLLGGNINFSSSGFSNEPDDYKNHSYNVSPSLGFVVKENKVVGVNLSYNHSIYQTAANQKSVSDTYGGGVFLRRYLTLGKGFYLYGQGQLGVGIGNQKETSSVNAHKTTSTSVSAGLFPGVAYAVSRRFHLELSMNYLVSVGYSSSKEHNANTPDIKSNQFNFSTNLNPVSSLALGFRILLGNK